MAIINRETDYAIRVIRALESGEYRTVPSICEEQKMKVPFTYKIIKKLQQRNIVEIERGAKGGIRLIADLNNVTLFDVMDSLDCLQAINSCFYDEEKCEFCIDSSCKVHHNLRKVQSNIFEQLKNVSIAELLQ